MDTKNRRFEMHRMTISGLKIGTEYQTLIRDCRKALGELKNVVWEHGGKSHALEEVHLVGGDLRLRFLSYKTGYRPDVLDTEDFTIGPNPLAPTQTGIDYTHALLTNRDRWILIVEKTQGGIFPNTMGLYLNWMLDEARVPPNVKLSTGEEVVVNIEPEPGEAFIQRIDALDRVTKASLRIVRPNPGWADLQDTLGEEASESNAAQADVTMTAKPRSELKKHAGIVQRIRSLFRSNQLGHAEISGVRNGDHEKFSTEQLGKKFYRNVPTEPNGQVNETAAYNMMEGIVEQDEAK